MTTTAHSSSDSSRLTIATIATCVLVTAGFIVGGLLTSAEGPWWVHLLIGMVAALALLVGVWFAPPSSLFSSTEKRSLTSAQARVKIAQLAAGAVATIALSLVFSGLWRGSGVITGIVVASIIGAAWRPKDDHSDTAARNGHDGPEAA